MKCFLGCFLHDVYDILEDVHCCLIIRSGKSSLVLDLPTRLGSGLFLDQN